MSERGLELRDRLLAPIAVRDAGGNVVGANLGALVCRLILFEQLLIDSYAMRELPYLIDAIGTDAFTKLLESKAVRLRVDGWTFGEMGNGGLVPGWGQKALPLLHYALSPIVPVDRKHHVSLCLGEIRGMALDKRTSQKVRLAIVDSLVTFPEDAGRKSLEALPRDLTRNLDLVHNATVRALSEKLAHEVADDAFEIRIRQIDEHVFAAETDFGARFELDETETDAVVQSALLSIGGLNQRLEEIEAYRAIIGFKDSELSLAQDKLRFLVNEVSPDAQEERFDRVVTLAGLPDPETAEGTVDIERLLEVRESDEIGEFRRWLRTLDQATDEEIEERLYGVRTKIAGAARSDVGKAARFIATNGVSFVPVVGPIAGIALGAADQFLLEELLPQPGPVSFIGHSYRSIFE